MKHIIKNKEPNSLAQHRANQPAFFDTLPIAAKDELRNSLLHEQGHICCYCMKRIPEIGTLENPLTVGMKVEHFKSQDGFPELQLTYSNLLGACMGNEGKPKKIQTCDTRKGDLELAISPVVLPPNCETLIKYNADGEIFSEDDAINKHLNEILNLNMQTLKNARREVYLQIQNKVETEGKQLKTSQLKLSFFIKEREKWIIRNENRFRPFCMVAVYYLTKKIRKSGGT